MQFTVRSMLAMIAVLAVPLAFWGWRLRTRVPFPAGLDVATIGSTMRARLTSSLQVLTSTTAKLLGRTHPPEAVVTGESWWK
jgi:hypothetical protein